MPIDLTSYALSIGRPAIDVEPWFEPVIDKGRGAAFVDTGFLKALLDHRDQYADLARLQFELAQRTNFYTTTLVFAEVVRRLAKDSLILEYRKRKIFGQCGYLMVEPGTVVLCAPPPEMAREAYQNFMDLRDFHPSLDLCDMVSLTVLQYAEHRRVFGFDRSHFETCGAALEP